MNIDINDTKSELGEGVCWNVGQDNWKVFHSEKVLFECLSKEILYIAKKCIEENGSFSIVLAGGNSPIPLYKILRDSNSNWRKWNIYFGDERCLPLNDKGRNDTKIMNYWLKFSSIPRKNINFITTEIGAVKAQMDYKKKLSNIKEFDVVLLGVGEDGHTASLFLDHVYPEDEGVIIESNSPKPPKERISMSYKRLNQSKNVFKLIIGKDKQRVVELLKNDILLPISKIYGMHKKSYIYTNIHLV